MGFVEERLNGRLIVYIVENREFMGLDFFVKEGVLILRLDIEILVEEIIEICREKKDVSILDIGIGFGVIIISLVKYIENFKIMFFDILEIVLEIVKKNVIINEVGEKIKYINFDLFIVISDSNIKFDIIVLNLLYIKK